MKIQTDKGQIRISSEVFTNITGAAATNCYGVKGMAVRSKTDGLVHLLRRESMAKGVKVTYNEDGTVSIELHIIVDNGVNLTGGQPLHHERGALYASAAPPAWRCAAWTSASTPWSSADAVPSQRKELPTMRRLY